MNGLKKKMSAAVAGILAVSMLSGCVSTQNDDAIVATVGEDKIAFGLANFYARMQQAQYETYYAGMMGQDPDTMWEQEVEDGISYQEDMKDSIMESLQNMYLLRQHAQEYEITLSEDEEKKINKAADKFVEENALEDKEVVSGYKEYVKEYLELVTIQKKMDGPMKKGIDENVSDEEAAQKKIEYVEFSYTKTDESGNVSDMTEEEKTALKETAQNFLDTVSKDAGRDMNAAAAEAGTEVESATFDAETVTMEADLIHAADALENEGDLTDVIEAESGLYVAKLVSKLDREATDQKKEQIIEERKQEQYDSLIEQWRKDTDIKVEEKEWKKVDFVDQGVQVKQTEEETGGENTEGTP